MGIFKKSNFSFLLFFVLSLAAFAQEARLKPMLEKTKQLFKNGQFDSVIVSADELLHDAEKANSDHYVLRAFYQKALAYMKLNKTHEAVDMYYKALRFCTDTSSLKIKGYIYNQLGEISFGQKNMALAKSCFRHEIGTKREAGDPDALAASLLNLSAVYRALREFDSSAVVLGELKKIMSKFKDPKTMGYYYNAVAVQYHG
ncbi:MAG: hypothetical protein ACXVP0_13885, partial [Bacteroidia bacterium]